MIGESIGKRRYCERWIRPNRSRHDRSVRDEKPGVFEHFAVAIDDAAVRIVRHRTATDGVHRDDLAVEVRDRVGNESRTRKF
jgi:hypothetical protein